MDTLSSIGKQCGESVESVLCYVYDVFDFYSIVVKY